MLLCGMLGCVCFGTGDWLMLYGDPAHAGVLLWLTKGATQIPQWRYDLAMALAFPGIILCAGGEGAQVRRIFHDLQRIGRHRRREPEI